jgi:hypothetical protein
MKGLSKKVSQAVICEMTAALGESRAAEMTGLETSQLEVLLSGKGNLPDWVLDRIKSSTGKTWRDWLLDAAKRAGVASEIISATAKLIANLNEAETPEEQGIDHAGQPGVEAGI